MSATDVSATQPPTTTLRISGDLLVPHFRPVRLPLPVWARALLESVSGDRPVGPRTGNDAFERISSAFNEAALVEVHAGRCAEALALCRASIQMTGALVAQTSRLSLAQFAFQPYINEGRLDRLQGRWDTALDKFDRLGSFLVGRTVHIGPLEVTAEHAKAIAQENSTFRDRMHANYVVDIVTTLLRASRFDEAVSFATAQEAVATACLIDLLKEARLVSLARLGSIDRAMRVAETYLRDLSSSNRSVFLCRRAELLTATGTLDTAAHILRQLAQAQMGAASRGGVNLRLVLLVARLLARLADSLALDTARAGLTAAERIDDVVFQQEFLGLVAELHSEPAEQLAARRRAEIIARDSWYGRDANAPVQDRVNRDLIDVLHERLLTLAGNVVER